VQKGQELIAGRIPEAALAGSGQADAALSQIIERTRLSQEIEVVEVCYSLQDRQLFGCAFLRPLRGRPKRRRRT
jgi:hypothetical protein